MDNFTTNDELAQDVKRRMSEEFIKNLNGTTIEETFLVIYSAPLLTFISLVCVNRLFSNLLLPEKFCRASFINILILLLIELFVIIIPLILINTIFSEFLGLTSFVISFLCLYIVVVNVSIPDGKHLYWNKPNLSDLLSIYVKGQKRSYITLFRSLINIITAICILAVDFNIFPRRFAKTETFGFGLMDIGVGLFVVSNSIVLKSDSQSINYKTITQTVLGNTVLFVLGLIRFFTISHVNYQTHITEYGVHWNFFFTLGFTQLISRIILFSDSMFKKCHFLSLFIIIFHQYGLSSGLEDWILNKTSRNTFLDANKEGIVSLTGYVGLYLVGVSIAKCLTSVKSTIKSELILVAKMILSTIFFYCLTIYLDTWFPASRRLVNITYITWVIGVSLMVLCLCLILEMLFKCLLNNVSNKEDNIVPVICQSVSYNGLLFFLLSNVLTGIVNILFETISMDVLTSLFILVGYMVVLCGFVEILYYKQIKVKFW